MKAKVAGKFWGSKISIFRLSAFLLPLLFVSFSFRVLDPKAKTPNVLLQTIAPALDKMNIHVIQDWHSKLKVDNRQVIIAPLSSWPNSNNSQFTDGWVKELKDGLQAGYAAMRYKGKISQKDVPKIWKRISRDKRIFISFTGSDIKYAEQLRHVLEQKGYQVFTYIKDGAIGQSYEEVGKIMSTAGQHLVIDTYNSRTSEGVIAEALTHATYELKYPVVELLPPDKKTMLVDGLKAHYTEELINALVKSGVPLGTYKGKSNPIYFDPGIDKAGSFFQACGIRINGKNVTGAAELSHWIRILEEHHSNLSKEALQKMLPPDALFISTELFEKEMLRQEKQKTERAERTRELMEEQRRIRDAERSRTEEINHRRNVRRR